VDFLRYLIIIIFIMTLGVPSGTVLAGQHVQKRPSAPAHKSKLSIVANFFEVPKSMAARMLSHPKEKEIVSVILRLDHEADEVIEGTATVSAQEQAIVELLAHFEEAQWDTLLKELEEGREAFKKNPTNKFIPALLEAVYTIAKKMKPAIQSGDSYEISGKGADLYQRMQSYRKNAKANSLHPMKWGRTSFFGEKL